MNILKDKNSNICLLLAPFIILTLSIKLILQPIKNRFLIINQYEKIFIFLMLGLLIFLLSPWGKYDIIFTEQYTVHHTLVTNDFIIFCLIILTSLIPQIICFISNLDQNLFSLKTILVIFFSRSISLITLPFLYIIYLLNPSYLSQASNMTFTLPFYVFGILIIPSIVYGFLGLYSYIKSKQTN